MTSPFKRRTIDPQGNTLNPDSELVQTIDNDPKLNAWPSQQTLKIGEPVMIRQCYLFTFGNI